MKCPCCKQEMEGYPDPEEAVAQMRLACGPKRVLEKLVSRFGYWVPVLDIADYVYHDSPNGGPLSAGDVMRKNVHIIRKSGELERVGLFIDSEAGRYELGYRLMWRE